MVLDRNLESLALWYSFLKLTLLSFHFQMKISTSQGWPFKIHAFYEPCLQLEYPATSPLSPLPEKLESHLKYNLLPRPPFSAPGLSPAVLPLPQPCLHCLFHPLYNEFLTASALFSIIPRLPSSSNSIWPVVPSQ